VIHVRKAAALSPLTQRGHFWICLRRNQITWKDLSDRLWYGEHKFKCISRNPVSPKTQEKKKE
jgi:hypothetical protein